MNFLYRMNNSVVSGVGFCTYISYQVPGLVNVKISTFNRSGICAYEQLGEGRAV